MRRTIWIGWDPREAGAYAVARHSVQRRLKAPIRVRGVVLDDLIERGLYTRPTERRDGQMWDVISQAPMSTEHAIARFLTPHLAQSGWVLFMDGDMLARADLGALFDTLDPNKAAYCVKHDHRPAHAVKMDGQLQTAYPRKNWSSFLLLNADHAANKALTVDLVNTAPGRDLHRFCWLADDQIGGLDPAWNYLVGHSDPTIDPKVVHFTEGTPEMPGYERQPFADEWRCEQARWAA